jgi:DNA polymerase-3 subunit epsilon
MSVWAVVDVETTGFSKVDRIVEVGVVLLNGESLEVVDEYETLINPMRDMGATHVHGISASMVEAAPTFGEIADYLGSILNDTVLVAHNLPFDARMLAQEYARTNITFDAGEGLNTLTLSGERLPAVCARLGIPHGNAHSAIADARAVAAILQALEPSLNGRFARAQPLLGTVRRTYVRQTIGAHLAQDWPIRITGVRLPSSRPGELSYLDVLDRFLSDRVLDDDERDALADLASDLGLSEFEQRHLNMDYMQGLIYAAQRDNVITVAEHEYLTDISRALGLNPASLPPITERVKQTTLDGQRVCFTGAATINGRALERRTLEAMAARAGLQPVASVSKKGCDLVVAADAASMSGKAQKARDMGIPVMSVAEFLEVVSPVVS